MKNYTFSTRQFPITFTYGDRGIHTVRLHSTRSTSVLDAQAAHRRVSGLVPRMRAHLDGGTEEFLDIELDWSGIPRFALQVYQELRRSFPGKTMTYGELATRCGRPGAARAVARATATNRLPIFVPCHRVVGANGRLTGFSGGDGLKTKCQLLWAEGARPVVAAGDAFGGSLNEDRVYEIAVHSLRSRDRHFAVMFDQAGMSRPPEPAGGDGFAALVEVVCYQQLAGKAAATIFGNVQRALGGAVTPAGALAAGEKGLRPAGLSGAKTAAVLALARAVESGSLDLCALPALPYDSLLEALTAVKGIGPWSAQMYAIFRLGHPDVFAPGDLGIRKAVTLLAGSSDLLSVDRVEKFGRRWRPFRTVATWYLWRSLGTQLIGD